MIDHSKKEVTAGQPAAESGRPVASLRSDSPITRSKDDRLNRTSLAEALARAIINIDAKESLVIGIYGGWGTGKTSLLNLLEEQLEAESILPPIIMRFNPWDFSTQEQLTSQFFHELSVFLRLHQSIPKLSLVADTVQQYGALLSPVAGVLAPQYTVMTKVGWALFRRLGPKSVRTTIDLKAEINRALGSLGRKLVILVDDIDRLNSPEIRQTFQLIKLNANFSNTVYVTAFKKEAVEKALTDVSPGPADEYLEKIVQVAFAIPAVSETKLTEFIIDNFNETLKVFAGPELDQQRFGNMFQSGFRAYFKTLRDVTRYFNAFRFALAMIGDDTNFTDLAAVEALALFEPELYLAIEAHSRVFAGEEKREGDKQFQEVLESAKLRDPKAAKDLCIFLFPKRGKGNVIFGTEFEKALEKDKRVCSSRYFPFYFQLAVPEGQVSNAEMTRALQECTSVEQFVAVLARFNSAGKLSAFSDLLRHRIGDLDKSKLLIILSSIFVYGDQVNLEASGFLNIASDHMRLASWLLMDILELLGVERYDHLIQAMIGRPAVYTVVATTARFEQALSRNETDPQINRRYPNLTAATVGRMKSAAVDVIRLAVREHRLQNAPVLPFILFRWREWANPKEVEAYVQEAFLSNPQTAVRFVTKFMGKVQSISMNDKVPTVHNRMELKSIAEFDGLKRVAALVREANDESLNAEELQAKRIFLEKMRQLDSGKSIEAIDSPINLD